MSFIIWACWLLLLNIGGFVDGMFMFFKVTFQHYDPGWNQIPACGQQRAKVSFTTEIQMSLLVRGTAAKCCHLRLHGALCPSSCDPSAAGESLQRACHQAHWHQSVLHVAGWHITAGLALWPGGESSSIAVAALALIMHTPTHYSSPWGDADRGTGTSIRSTSSHSVEVAIHGNAWSYSLMDH